MKRMIAAWLVWWVCLATGVVALIWMSIAGLFHSRERAFQIAVAFDQLGNATGAGDEDETFSARCWRMRKVNPRYEKLQRAIDRVFMLLADEMNHCESAFNAELARRKRPYRVK